MRGVRLPEGGDRRGAVRGLRERRSRRTVVELTDDELHEVLEDSLQAWLDKYGYIDIYDLDATFVDDMVIAYRTRERT